MAVYMRIVGTLALWVMLVGADPAWSVNRAEQDALLAKLQRAVESKAVVAAKTARPVNGGSSTVSQIELKFSSKEEAVSYAKKNSIDYEVLETSERKVINKSYADNFK